eukprot:2864813-Rhodomonas_salina.3
MLKDSELAPPRIHIQDQLATCSSFSTPWSERVVYFVAGNNLASSSRRFSPGIRWRAGPGQQRGGSGSCSGCRPSAGQDVGGPGSIIGSHLVPGSVLGMHAVWV